MPTIIQTGKRFLTNRGPMGPIRPIAMIILVVLLLAGQAHALWMPWATEPDKIKKCIDDVWKAFLSGNRGLLEENLVTGPSSQTFIAQELDFIRKMGVVDFYFRFRNIKVDRVKNEWAWVTLDKIARLRNGARMNTSTVMVFKKVDGFWKLYTNPKTMSDRRKEAVVRKEIKWNSGSGVTTSEPSGPKARNNGFQWVKGPITGAPREEIKSSDQSLTASASDKTAVVQNGWAVTKLDESGAKKPSGQWTAEPITKGEDQPKTTEAKPPKAEFKWANPSGNPDMDPGKPMAAAATSEPRKEQDSESTSNGWTIKKGPAPTLMDVIKNHEKLK